MKSADKDGEGGEWEIKDADKDFNANFLFFFSKVYIIISWFSHVNHIVGKSHKLYLGIRLLTIRVRLMILQNINWKKTSYYNLLYSKDKKNISKAT